MAQTANRLTTLRPQVPKQTKSLTTQHHKFEEYLANPYLRKLLGLLTQRGADGRCYLEKVFETYDQPGLHLLDRAKYAIPHHIIETFRAKTSVSKQVLKDKVFHHLPTARALVNTAKSIAAYGLTTPQRFVAPLIAVWNITQACNLTCKHCYQDAAHKPLADELTWEEKRRVIDELADAYVPFVAFAGGEPLVTKDIWRVLEHCQRRKLHVTVATNGTLLTRETCQRLVELGVKYVEVSIDSCYPNEHDTWRGLPGSWQRAIDGIKNVSSTPGLRAGMATCFTRENVHLADQVIRLAKDIGCTTFVHFNFIPVGRGTELAHLDITPAQRESLLRTLNYYLQEGEISIMSTAPQLGRACLMYGPEDGLMATAHAGSGRGKQTKVLSKYIGGCGAGRCYCSIQPNGIVTACVYMPSHIVGDLRRQRFEEIWDNALFATLSDREDRADHCGVCDFRHYCGGCRARAYSYTGDAQAGDPGCVYNQHIWDKIAAKPEAGLRVLGQHACCDTHLAAAAGVARPEEVVPSQMSQLASLVGGSAEREN